MHAVSTNQIADVLHFNDKDFNSRLSNCVVYLNALGTYSGF